MCYSSGLTTHRGDGPIAAGRGHEVEKLVEAARHLRDRLQADRE